MKRIYQTPLMTTLIIEGQAIMNIATSNTTNIDTSDSNSITEGDAWVKSSRQNYNVWDDDWSK